jgi:hypothetical protein
MDHVEQWLADSAFNKSLGVVTAELSDERVVLELPFDEGNTNPGNVLHGGVAASMIAPRWARTRGHGTPRPCRSRGWPRQGKRG